MAEKNVHTEGAKAAAHRIVMLGAGNVATHLALAIAQTRSVITAVYSRTKASAVALAARFGDCLATDAVEDLPSADIYIISVKDDAIADVAQRLASVRPEAVAVHTAGSVPLNVLAQKFGQCGVLYPMQTLSRNRMVDFSAVPLFVEGNTPLLTTMLRDFAESLSQSVTVMDSDQRRYLHLASVFACNFVNHCYDKAFGICEQHAIDPQVLLPLIAETAAKVRTMHPHEGQTGPARRHDHTVLDRQRALLDESPECQHLYDELSNSITQSYDLGG